jgi:TonB family protein
MIGRHTYKIAGARSAAAILTLGALVALPCRADDDIPTYKVLTCEHQCPVFVPAVPINKRQPFYPSLDTGRSGLYTEAQVDVRFTIGTDGSVKDARIEHLIGPPEFGENVLTAVNQYKYQPATEDGHPVEQNRRIRFTFQIGNPVIGARTNVVAAYRAAVQLAKNQKPDEAIAALKGIIGEQRLNFYERTMVAYVLATIYMDQKNTALALEQIRDATLMEGRFLDPRAQEDAIRMRITLEAAAGEFAEAFSWFDVLKKHFPVSDDDPSAKLIARLHILLDGNSALELDASISPDAGAPPWQHTLLRRSFSFAGIEGKLNSFALRCDRHGIESAVSDKANWTVPKSWSGCVIYIAGAPGTKFQFVESFPDAAATSDTLAPKG